MMKKTDFAPIPLPQVRSNQAQAVQTRAQQPSTRMTVKVYFDLMEKIKDYAYWEGLIQQDILLQALELFFEDKSIKSRPEAVKNRAKVGRKPKA